MALTVSTGIQTSFTKTPQAVDDFYGWGEDALVAANLTGGNVIRLNVMANDLGGAAKSLYAINDGNGNTGLSDYELLNKDAAGVWEATENGNRIRIENGQVSLDIGNYLASIGASSVEAMAAGDHLQDEFVYAIRLANGTISQARVVIDIHGQNDAAAIRGTDHASMLEDGAAVAGTLIVSDVDHGEAHSQTVLTAAHNSSNGLGAYAVDQDGHWTYAVDSALVQHLGAGVHATDSFIVRSLDGTAQQTVTIDIVGQNDLATMRGATTGVVTEDQTATFGETLTVSDIDDGEAHTQAVAATAHNSLGGLGSYAVDHDGNWTYTVDQALIQYLGAGVHATDTFVVTSLDGTAQETVTIDLVGVNDAASISGADAGVVAEDDTQSVSGTLVATDIDDGESGFIARDSANPVLGTYGRLTIDADGNWTYQLNNGDPAVQGLTTGEQRQDSITVTSLDGTEHVIEILIFGADEPVIAMIDDGDETPDAGGGETKVPSDGPAVAAPYVGPNDPNDFDPLGGFGHDTINASNTGANNSYGGAGNDTLNGGLGNDAMYGGSGDDLIHGQNGSDLLFGGSGNDTITGNNSDDQITGGYGADSLAGGNGSDTFTVLSVMDTGDTITDFTAGFGGDLLDFSRIDSLTGGHDPLPDDDSPAFGLFAGTEVHANGINYFQSGEDTIVWADTDGDTATVEFQLTLRSVTAVDLVAGNFIQ